MKIFFPKKLRYHKLVPKSPQKEAFSVFEEWIDVTWLIYYFALSLDIELGGLYFWKIFQRNLLDIEHIPYYRWNLNTLSPPPYLPEFLAVKYCTANYFNLPIMSLKFELSAKFWLKKIPQYFTETSGPG